METAISYLTVLPTTREERNSFVKNAITEVLSGERSPLELQIMLTSIEKMVEAIRKDQRIQDYVLSELYKYPGQRALIKGVEVQIMTKSNYDYHHCQDMEWERLDSEIKVLTERKKEREAFLKHMTAPVADPETGEIINPPLNYKSEFVKITEK
ncbi:MAG: hypothetical protein EOL98_15605 [Negativicutes bacterium]|nr:hypothetical protein [Negativicutes bacterium]